MIRQGTYVVSWFSSPTGASAVSRSADRSRTAQRRARWSNQAHLAATHGSCVPPLESSGHTNIVGPPRSTGEGIVAHSAYIKGAPPGGWIRKGALEKGRSREDERVPRNLSRAVSLVPLSDKWAESVSGFAHFPAPPTPDPSICSKIAPNSGLSGLPSC